MKNILKNKLIQELGNDYEVHIDYMIKNICNYYPENYFLHLSLVKQIKKFKDLEQYIQANDEKEYIESARAKSIKRNPYYIELDKLEKSINQLVVRLSKTKKSKQQEDNESDYFFDFSVANEVELALELQFGILQWNYHAMSLNIEPEHMHFDQIVNQDYYIKHLQRNPLFDSSNLNWWHYQNVIDEIIEKNK